MQTPLLQVAVARRGGLPASFTAGMLLAALACRLAAASGELWLDEIWSLELSTHVRRPTEILTRLRHDNNHPLNTLLLWLLGPGRNGIIYRLPAVTAGTLAVLVGGLVAARAGRIAAVTAITLLSASYPLIHYSSEARGYGWLILFTLAAIESLLRACESSNGWWRALFWACCLGGFLSHPLFVHSWVATVYWTLLPTHNAKRPWAVVTRTAILLHAPPLVIAAALWRMQWSVMELGGGPPYSLSGLLAEAASITLGGPRSGWGALATTALLLAAAGIGIRALRQQRIGTLLLVATVLPIVQVVVAHPPFLFVRYFLTPMVLGLLASSVGLARLYRCGPLGRLAYAGCLIAFLFGNTCHTLELVRTGRGQCRAALAFLASRSTEPVVTVSSDHDFGIRKLIEFYAPRIEPRRSFQYIPGQQWPPAGPEWLVLHRESSTNLVPLEQVKHIEGHVFLLTRDFTCAPYSGWRWACYRRHPSPPPVPGHPGPRDLRSPMDHATL